MLCGNSFVPRTTNVVSAIQESLNKVKADGMTNNSPEIINPITAIISVLG